MPTEDEFYEKYMLVYNPFYADPEDCPWEGAMLDTFGEDLEHVLSYVRDPNMCKHVWTIVEGDDTLCICAGYHLVNRSGYLITEEPWEDDGEYYVCEDLCEHEDEEL